MAHGSVGSYGKKSPVTPPGTDPENVLLIAHYDTPDAHGNTYTESKQSDICIYTHILPSIEKLVGQKE
jgi:hypothetical protein